MKRRASLNRSSRSVPAMAASPISGGPLGTARPASPIAFLFRGDAQEQILQRRPGGGVAGAQLVGRTDRLERAALDDRDPVTEPFGGVEQVRREEDRAPA